LLSFARYSVCGSDVKLTVIMCRGCVDRRQHRQLGPPEDQHSNAVDIEPCWTYVQWCWCRRVFPEPGSRALDEMVSGVIAQVHFISDITWYNMSVCTQQLVHIWLYFTLSLSHRIWKNR